MAFTSKGAQGAVSPYRSCGRGFAAVDPERQREVDAISYLPASELPSPARVRRTPVEWFSPPRAPGNEGGSSRRSR